MSDCINEILTTEGMSGFYRGFGALIVQYALQFAIVRISTFSIRVSYLQIYAQVHAIALYTTECSSLKSIGTQCSHQ